MTCAWCQNDCVSSLAVCVSFQWMDEPCSCMTLSVIVLIILKIMAWLRERRLGYLSTSSVGTLMTDRFYEGKVGQ